jgi:hypothetical protein
MRLILGQAGLSRPKISYLHGIALSEIRWTSELFERLSSLMISQHEKSSVKLEVLVNGLQIVTLWHRLEEQTYGPWAI